jgi:hypothetical protein
LTTDVVCASPGARREHRCDDRHPQNANYNFDITSIAVTFFNSRRMSSMRRCAYEEDESRDRAGTVEIGIRCQWHAR